MVWYKKQNIYLRYKYIYFKLTVIVMRYTLLAVSVINVHDVNNGLVN